MITSNFHPRFQLALRRTIFFAIFLILWFVLGTCVFGFFTMYSQNRQRRTIEDKICENKRLELLNVLWAESVSQSESDWYGIANKKIELYEQVLFSHPSHRQSHSENYITLAMRKAFLLVSRIGPENPDNFTTEEKLFSVFYILIGAPLYLIVITQITKMISTIWKSSAIYLPFLGYLFISSVIYNIQSGNDDESFLDFVFSLGLMFAAVGKTRFDFDGFGFIIIIIGFSFLTVIFAHIQHEIERAVHGMELNFNRTFSLYERWMSEKEETANCYNTIIEEDEDVEGEEDST